jgi:hypothetical protein
VPQQDDPIAEARRLLGQTTPALTSQEPDPIAEARRLLAPVPLPTTAMDVRAIDLHPVGTTALPTRPNQWTPQPTEPEPISDPVTVLLTGMKRGVGDTTVGAAQFAYQLAQENPLYRMGRGDLSPGPLAQAVAGQVADAFGSFKSAQEAAAQTTDPDQAAALMRESLYRIAALPADLSGIPVTAIREDLKRGDFGHALGMATGAAALLGSLAALHANKSRYTEKAPEPTIQMREPATEPAPTAPVPATPAVVSEPGEPAPVAEARQALAPKATTKARVRKVLAQQAADRGVPSQPVVPTEVINAAHPQEPAGVEPAAPVAPATPSAPPAAEVKPRRVKPEAVTLTDDERVELARIRDDFAARPFESTVYTDLGPDVSARERASLETNLPRGQRLVGDSIRTAGHAGTPLYDTIVQKAAEQGGGGNFPRNSVIEAVDRLLAGKMVSNEAMRAVLAVARDHVGKDVKGLPPRDWYLSRSPEEAEAAIAAPGSLEKLRNDLLGVTHDVRDAELSPEDLSAVNAARATIRLQEELELAQRKGVAPDEGTSFNVAELEAPKPTQPAVDVLDTGELQPRLPGAESVRDQNIATPEVADAPFTLSPPKKGQAIERAARGEREAAGQTTLLGMPEREPTGGGSTLTAGVDPGLGPFWQQDLAPATRAVLGIAHDIWKTVSNAVVHVLEPAYRVRHAATMGEDVYARTMLAGHRPDVELLRFGQHESSVLDATFDQGMQWFKQFRPDQLRDLMMQWGDPDSLNALRLREEARERLDAGDSRLRDPKLRLLFREAANVALQLGRAAGFDIPEFTDYFYGTWKPGKGTSPEAMTSFLDHWVTTERWLKHKQVPTVADGIAAGLELRDYNPLANIRSEVRSIAQRAGLKGLRESIVLPKEGAAPEAFTLHGEPTQEEGTRPDIRQDARAYATWAKDATAEERRTWAAINEPLFKGMLFDPRYAKLVNNLIATNKVTSTWGLRQLRQAGFVAQQIKFFGSIFHYQNMAKASLVSEMGAVFNKAGYEDFGRAHLGVDRATPEYENFVAHGGGHTYSLEAGSVEAMTNAMDAFARGNRIGAVLRLPRAVAMEPWIPASPGFIRWQFDSLIPDLKFLKFEGDRLAQEVKVGRPLSDAEQIAILRRNQNFYGEMNERLFGRSGTVTSALRLIFMAPGFGEGNFRTAFRGATGDVLSARFMLQSLASVAMTATVASRVLTGHWPSPPQSWRDVRDVFKIRTPWVGPDNKPVLLDLMTFEKDWWTLYGNLATWQPEKIAPELLTRVGGATSAPYKFLVDLSLIFQNRVLDDWKGTPVWYQSDAFGTKVSKFLRYEAGELGSISLNVAGQGRRAGIPTVPAIGLALAGLRPTTSEQARRESAAVGAAADEKARQADRNAAARQATREAHPVAPVTREGQVLISRFKANTLSGDLLMYDDLTPSQRAIVQSIIIGKHGRAKPDHAVEERYRRAMALPTR